MPNRCVGGRWVRTIPLFKLLPGRPRSNFFSSSFFLGGILLRFLAEEVAKLRPAELLEGCLVESTNAGWTWGSNAGPAALRENPHEVELKKDGS